MALRSSRLYGTHYQTFRSWGLIGGAAAVALALFSFRYSYQETFLPGLHPESSSPDYLCRPNILDKNQYASRSMPGLILVTMSVVFVAGSASKRKAKSDASGPVIDRRGGPPTNTTDIVTRINPA